MKCLYNGACKKGKGNRDGECKATLRFQEHCRYRVRQSSESFADAYYKREAEVGSP